MDPEGQLIIQPNTQYLQDDTFSMTPCAGTVKFTGEREQSTVFVFLAFNTNFNPMKEMENKMWPKNDPCRTPIVTSNEDEVQLSSVTH